MTTPAIFAFCVAIFFLAICVYQRILLHRKDRDLAFLEKELAVVGENLRFANDTTVSLTAKIDQSQKEYSELQNKFQKNPSYECQQLLRHLLNGHALFHIETIDPENILLRRR